MKLVRYVIAAGVVALAGGATRAAASPMLGPVDDALNGARFIAPHRLAQDSAETLYTAGRDAFGRGDFRRASDLFQQVATRWPKSARRNDALYWRAYSLYRIGGSNDLRDARTSLATLRSADRESYRRDGAALDTRICGALAQRGDSRCAATVEQRADSADLAGAMGELARGVVSVAGNAVIMAAGAASNALRDPEIQQAIVEASAATQEAARAGGRAVQDAMRDANRSLRDAQREVARTGVGRRSQDDCQEDENDDRLVALNALLQMDAASAMPLLKKVMARRDKCSEVLRRKAVFLIAQKKAPESADILVDAARNDPDTETRQQATFWLSRVDSQRSLQFLREMVMKPGDVEARKNGVFALAQMDTPEAREALHQVARNNEIDADVREQAIFWLGQRGSAEDVDFLKSLYAQIQNRDLKDKTLFAVSRRKNNAAWLLDIAQDAKEPIDLRKQALFYAGQGGAPMEQLVALYDRATDHDMKEQLIFVYQQRGGNGPAFDKLLDIGRNEKDKDLRSKAVFWLSRSKDPRALKLLEDIISK